MKNRFPGLALASLLSSISLLTGCVSTALQLSADHPARPNAPSGVVGEPATILLPNAVLYREEPVSPVSEEDTVEEVPDGGDALPGITGHPHAHGSTGSSTVPSPDGE